MVKPFLEMAENTKQTRRVPFVHRQVEDLCKNFDTYLAEFNADPLYGDTLSQHKKMLGLKDKLGGVVKSIESDKYLRDLRSMLKAWGMNKRGAKLQEENKFVVSVLEYKCDIAELERVGVAQIDEDVSVRRELWRIIQGMKLSQSETSQTVTGTKALHHLLPQLMPPIDGGYTRPFFRYQSTQTNDNKYAFNLMLWYFAQIAQEVDLGQYVRPETWATSESKLIDNAIIGYCKRHPGLKKKYDYNWRSRVYKKKGGTMKPEARKADAHIWECGLCMAAVSS